MHEMENFFVTEWYALNRYNIFPSQIESFLVLELTIYLVQSMSKYVRYQNSYFGSNICVINIHRGFIIDMTDFKI